MDLFHGKLVSLLFCNTNKPSNSLRYVQKVNVDKILKSILKRQIPFLIGGTITGESHDVHIFLGNYIV